MASNLITKILFIEDMSCVNCENIIERTLSEASGIIRVEASYSKGTADVTYDEQMISLEQVIELLGAAGYHVRKEGTEPGWLSSQKSDGQRSGTGDSAAENHREKRGSNTTGSNGTNLLGFVIILLASYIIANHFGLFNLFNLFPVAKEGMGYGMLFLIGVLTSVHCMAMCGGICLTQCVPKKEGAFTNKFSALKPSLLYNLGRVVSYTVIGGIVGAIGTVVSFSGSMKGIVQILAGIFMVIMGINMLNIFPWLRKFNPRMPKIIAKKIYAGRNSSSPFFIGLLNGLMPCGPLQAMQLYALSTGSPIQGAVSMFLFSIGTVPLMFVFGAISSFLSKKFTSKMFSVSAILVVFLGVFMLNNGIALSGVYLPSLSAYASTASTTATAKIEGDVQVVTTGLSSGRYEPIIVQKGIPVKWTIQAQAGDINGCNNSIVINEYNIQKDLETGDNVIEFTPTESGTIPFSCWMGMIRSKITVVDDLNNIDSSVIEDAGNTAGTAGAGGCCGAGTYSGQAASGSKASGSDNSNVGFGSAGTVNSGNFPDAEIPTDQIAVAKIKDDGTQTIEITYNNNGYTPAVLVVQSGLETVWNIKAVDVDGNTTMEFPYYNAQLEVANGDNTVSFIPDKDFDFRTSDQAYYGYVKVVDDIKSINPEAIKKEVANYKPSDFVDSWVGSGASCH